jgi:hypothetical protein
VKAKKAMKRMTKSSPFLLYREAQAVMNDFPRSLMIAKSKGLSRAICRAI